MCLVDDGSSPEFFHQENPTARKSHECDECRRVIQPGEEYERVCGKWDGEVDTFKTCAHCVEARRWLVKHCNGFLYHGVYEDLREHFNDDLRYRVDGLGRLLVGMRRRWRGFRGGLMPVPVWKGAS
jgi:hypothetical protein